MSASCRHPSIIAVATLACLLTGEGWQPPGRPPPSPSDCDPVYAATLPRQGSLVTYRAGADILCGRAGNASPYGGGTPYTTSEPVPDGTPCYIVYYAPVTFQNLPAYIHATWRSPAGIAGAANVGPNSFGDLVSTAGVTAATNDIFALYRENGTFQTQQCHTDGFWFDFCQLAAPAPNPDPCILTTPHLIAPPSSPPPPVSTYVASVARDIRAQAGDVHSLPSPNGLVNLPTCFWIDGIGVPDERDFTLVLPGSPDPSNRRIYYTYLIRVFFAGIDWNFDDPFGNDTTQPHPDCGQHPQLTAHSYQMISEKHSTDGFYHVTATERYQVTVDLYWDDSYGPHRSVIDPGVQLPITVSPPGPYNQFIGQVEAIPIGS